MKQLILHYYKVRPKSNAARCKSDSAQVDATTLDISCPTKDIVRMVYLSGAGVGWLCSFYINGGMDLSLTVVAIVPHVCNVLRSMARNTTKPDQLKLFPSSSGYKMP